MPTSPSLVTALFHKIFVMLMLIVAFFYLLIRVLIRGLARQARINIESFVDYFEQLANSQLEIAPPSMAFSEFQTIARSATTMIAKRRQAERDLRASERRFRTLVEVNLFSGNHLSPRLKRLIGEAGELSGCDPSKATGPEPVTLSGHPTQPFNRSINRRD